MPGTFSVTRTALRQIRLIPAQTGIQRSISQYWTIANPGPRLRGDDRCFQPCIARQTRSGVAGISMCFMPNSDNASISALVTAGSAPTQPASPRP